MNHQSLRRAARGFTLLEVMSALFLMAVIIGMVVSIARTSLQLSRAIVDAQAEEMKQQAFFDLLSRQFSSLPGNAVVDVKVEDTGSRYLSTVTIQNAPMNFTWGGQDRVAKAVTLRTVPRRNGFVDVVMGFHESEVLEGTGDEFDRSKAEEGPFAEIVLVEGLAYFEWRMWNSSTSEWQYEWNDRARLPLQFELVMAVGARGQEMRHIFWLPPKPNPELVMRQLARPPGQTGAPGGDVRIEADREKILDFGPGGKP